MNSQICRSASRAAKSLISASSKQSSRAFSGGRAAAAAATVSLRGVVPSLASYGRTESGNASRAWISGVLALPAAVSAGGKSEEEEPCLLLNIGIMASGTSSTSNSLLLHGYGEQEAHAAEMERTFIAIKPDGVQRGLSMWFLLLLPLFMTSQYFRNHITLRRKNFKLVAIKFSGPVLAMVWEGEGVIRYGRKLIGATDPQKSEPGTIRGDLAVVVARNIIHGSVARSCER
ncbi:hypothetical protein HAX54_040941 [Datura stramonium]|uniref:nucleoside-diphosphate kinase n=1 Tax=Datura stramonium TaxID=4076 RepID=A0ABS8SL29_DATST|nr:hypothetical protein [Datura stramonium]